MELRPATDADSEFCYQLHKAAMGDYIAAIWGWDEQVQRGYHARAVNPGRWQVVTANGADVGMLDVEYRPREIYLSRIEIHPDHLGHGIGARLISALIDEAQQKAKTWLSTCCRSTTVPKPSTGGSAWPRWPGMAITTSRSP